MSQINDCEYEGDTTRPTPMGIDLIIREILKFLPRNELLKCRLIDRAWNVNSTLVYSQNRIYIFRSFWRNPKKFFADMDAEDAAFQLFNKVMLPLEATLLEDWITFSSKFGPHVKLLWVRLYTGAASWNVLPSDYKLKLRIVLQSVPHLESLRLEGLPYSISQSFVFTKDELKLITLSNVKKLEIHVGFNGHFVGSHEFREGLLSMLPNVNQFWSPMLIPIRAKNFHDELKAKKLTSVEAAIEIRDQDDLRNCETFFEHQSETLQILVLNFYISSSSWVNLPARIKFPLPVMKKLTVFELTLQSEVLKHGFNSIFEPLPPKNIPNVNKLEISLDCIKAFLDGVFDSVTELRVCQYPPMELLDIHLDKLREIRRLFPNLRKFLDPFLMLNDEAVAIIFSFPKLDRLDFAVLSVNLKKNFNYTLSGLSAESASLVSQNSFTNNTALMPSSLERIHPSLHSMKHLKILQVGFYFRPPFEIDEVGVFAFLSMPRLERLDLYGRFTISEKGAAELKNYHHNVIFAPKVIPSTDP